MSEIKKGPPRLQPIEAFETSLDAPNASIELLQFTDSVTALLLRHRGQKVEWERFKHARPYSENNCTILTMSDGLRIGAGGSVIGLMPELDTRSGRFRGETRAIEIEEMAPDGLPDVTIGEPWPLTGDRHGVVESVMIRYKLYDHGTAQNQVNAPSHLEHAQHLLNLAWVDLARSKDPEGFYVLTPPSQSFD